MSDEEIKVEIAHRQALISDYTKRLRVRERQAAVYGLNVPPEIEIEINELKEKIRECEGEIQRLRSAFTYHNSIFSSRTLTDADRFTIAIQRSVKRWVFNFTLVFGIAGVMGSISVMIFGNTRFSVLTVLISFLVAGIIIDAMIGFLLGIINYIANVSRRLNR